MPYLFFHNGVYYGQQYHATPDHSTSNNADDIFDLIPYSSIEVCEMDAISRLGPDVNYEIVTTRLINKSSISSITDKLQMERRTAEMSTDRWIVSWNDDIDERDVEREGYNDASRVFKTKQDADAKILELAYEQEECQGVEVMCFVARHLRRTDMITEAIIRTTESNHWAVKVGYSYLSDSGVVASLSEAELFSTHMEAAANIGINGTGIQLCRITARWS
jgi:hypothetical protein